MSRVPGHCPICHTNAPVPVLMLWLPPAGTMAAVRAQHSLAGQTYAVPLIQPDLRREEAIQQVADALQYLQRVSGDIFSRWVPPPPTGWRAAAPWVPSSPCPGRHRRGSPSDHAWSWGPSWQPRGEELRGRTPSSHVPERWSATFGVPRGLLWPLPVVAAACHWGVGGVPCSCTSSCPLKLLSQRQGP